MSTDYSCKGHHDTSVLLDAFKGGQVEETKNHDPHAFKVQNSIRGILKKPTNDSNSTTEKKTVSFLSDPGKTVDRTIHRKYMIQVISENSTDPFPTAPFMDLSSIVNNDIKEKFNSGELVILISRNLKYCYFESSKLTEIPPRDETTKEQKKPNVCELISSSMISACNNSNPDCDSIAFIVPVPIENVTPRTKTFFQSINNSFQDQLTLPIQSYRYPIDIRDVNENYEKIMKIPTRDIRKNDYRGKDIYEIVIKSRRIEKKR